jgi:hypothetical protein
MIPKPKASPLTSHHVSLKNLPTLPFRAFAMPAMQVMKKTILTSSEHLQEHGSDTSDTGKGAADLGNRGSAGVDTEGWCGWGVGPDSAGGCANGTSNARGTRSPTSGGGAHWVNNSS